MPEPKRIDGEDLEEIKEQMAREDARLMQLLKERLTLFGFFAATVFVGIIGILLLGQNILQAEIHIIIYAAIWLAVLLLMAVLVIMKQHDLNANLILRSTLWLRKYTLMDRVKAHG